MIYKYKNLEERTFLFAQKIRLYVKQVKKETFKYGDAHQVLRSSGSVGANYIETNESFSKKDFIYRMKLVRKEAKETVYWLKLLEADEELLQEAIELQKIFGSIVSKLQSKGDTV